MLFKSPIVKSGFTALTVTSFFVGSRLSIAAEGGEPKGLPQLDISTWPNQLLWLAATFLVGYLLMAKVIIPRIGTVLNTRRQTIFDDLKRAKDADAEAKQMKEDYESALETARITAAEAASKAMAEAKAKAEAAEVELTAKLAKKTKAAEIKLSKMRDEALANIHDVAKELTLDTVSSVTGMKVKKTDADKAIKKVTKLSGQEA